MKKGKEIAVPKDAPTRQKGIGVRLDVVAEGRLGAKNERCVPQTSTGGGEGRD